MDASPGIPPCQHTEHHSDPISASLGLAPLATRDSTDPIHSTPKLQCSQCQDAAAPPCPGQAAQPCAPLPTALLMSTAVHPPPPTCLQHKANTEVLRRDSCNLPCSQGNALITGYSLPTLSLASGSPLSHTTERPRPS